MEAMFGMVDTVVENWPREGSGSTADESESEGVQECMEGILDDAAESVEEAHQMAAEIVEEIVTAVVQDESTEMKGEAFVSEQQGSYKTLIRRLRGLIRPLRPPV